VIFLAGLAMPRAMVQPPGAPPPPAPAIPQIVTFRTFRFIAGTAFVLAGARTAPRRRVIVAAVLAALWIGYAFLYTIYVHLGRGTPHYFDFALAIAAAGGAAVLIYYVDKAAERRA
jgi:peptidoglycan/LPS O-acetylase OafA/YrhL